MSYLAAYLVALVVLVVLDLVWLAVVKKPLLRRHVGNLLRDGTRIGAAIVFYVIYVGGIFYFAILPALQVGSWRVVLLHGALLGLLAYGTYHVTNMATLRGWHFSIVAIGTAWGTALSAVAGLAGWYAAGAVAG